MLIKTQEKTRPIFLTEQAWLIKNSLQGQKGNFYLRYQLTVVFRGCLRLSLIKFPNNFSNIGKL